MGLYIVKHLCFVVFHSLFFYFSSECITQAVFYFRLCHLLTLIVLLLVFVGVIVNIQVN